ncbi:helix-turn-helix domain-containing protein [Paenibacillus sp. FSL K6-2859]|jgi:excisionase family DNA binding protein|uniref:helix-turn-helix domain-containing protein n=1 Tax=Paenibacillus sp. FSL K6-2859 TaxID=2921482 RepID=UPI0030FCCC81
MYNDNEILNVEQLADLLQVGYSTVYRLLKKEEISSFRIGNCYRIQRSEVMEYIIRKSKRKYISNNL